MIYKSFKVSLEWDPCVAVLICDYRNYNILKHAFVLIFGCCCTRSGERGWWTQDLNQSLTLRISPALASSENFDWKQTLLWSVSLCWLWWLSSEQLQSELSPHEYNMNQAQSSYQIQSSGLCWNVKLTLITLLQWHHGIANIDFMIILLNCVMLR